MIIEGVTRKHGRPKSHGRIVLKDLQMLGINTDLTKGMEQWKKKIHIGENC